MTSHEFLIGYVLSDARFDWLVGNMSVYEENLFQSRKKCSFISRSFSDAPAVNWPSVVLSVLSSALSGGEIGKMKEYRLKLHIDPGKGNPRSPKANACPLCLA